MKSSAFTAFLDSFFFQFLFHFFDLFILLDVFFFFVLIIGVGFLWTPWLKKGRSMLTLLVLFFLLGTVFIPLGGWSVTFLENRFPRLEDIPRDTSGIILLGGNFDLKVSSARGVTSYNLASGRLLSFIELAHSHPQMRLVFTGGGRIEPGELTEAARTKKVLDSFGFDTSRIEFEDRSRNTIENAVLTYQMVQPKPHEKWVLVTSAIHMPRAVGLFRKAGWTVIPYPVDYHTTGSYSKRDYFNLFSFFHTWHYGMHEWTGLILNYLFGKSDDFIPSPSMTADREF